MSETVSCWQQLVKLDSISIGMYAPDARVMFEVAGHQLAPLIGELQRLGGCKLEFRWLGDDRALLRAIGVSTFSLLRCNASNEISAFVEQRAGVWVEAGYRHPLATQLICPQGKILCIKSSRSWTYHDDDAFRDVDGRVSFAIPSRRHSLIEQSPPKAIPVPLKLAANSSGEHSELWVLRQSGVRQVQHLIEEADDRIVSQLQFAVADSAGSQIVVVRTRSARQTPPELLLNGVKFHAYARLHNLFVPSGTRLEPPLRRDVVRKIFLPEAGRLAWLFPVAKGFVLESLPEKAFRPLHDWVDYCVENAPTALIPWSGTPLFQFETFAADQDRPHKTIVVKRHTKKPAPEAQIRDPEASAVERAGSSRTTGSSRESDAQELLTAEQAAPDAIRLRLSDVETSFLELQEPLDDASRQDLWRQMAELHTALKQSTEAALCWAYAFWETRSPGLEQINAWRLSEQPFRPEDVEKSSSAGAVRSLIAHLVHAAASGTVLDSRRIQKLARVVEKNEGGIPVRLAWIAHAALYRLARGDVLALTRARDRVLERLFQFGLRVELDLPGFLRFSGKVGRDRVHAVHDHMQRLRRTVHAWLKKNPRSGLTAAYADLTFAFGLARLGGSSQAEQLLAECGKALEDKDALHSWLFDAYASRVRSTIRGELGKSALPDELVARLNGFPSDLRYKGDRLREHSRILEPHEKIDAKFRWHQHYPDEIERELAFLSGLADRGELAKRLTKLLDGKKIVLASRSAILAKALELAPRLDEQFACGLLARVTPSLSSAGATIESRALLLEKGMYLAAHFDQTPFVLQFVERFMDMVSTGSAAAQAIEPLIEQLFFGLRKFGLRDLVGQSLERLTALLVEGQDLPQLRKRLSEQAKRGMLKEALTAWKSLLHIASGWLYFGNEGQARPILNETRALLLQNVLHPLEQAEMACRYIRCLGQADLEPAASRWLELFHKIKSFDQLLATDSHVALLQLRLVEALVLTLASDEFTLDPQIRHWMEDDEYLIRRRIHRDVKSAMGEAGI